MSSIYLKNISKKYGEVTVFNNFTCDIPLNGRTVIMGESGCGKTTLLNLLMKFEVPDSGTISGVPTQISAVFQDDCLCEDFSAISNLYAVIGRKNNKATTEKYLLALGLTSDDISRPVKELSGGMKRRVAIARALIANGDLVIMDEPFKGLDDDTRRKAIEFVLKDTKEKERGLIVITHSPAESKMLMPDKTILLD